MVASNLVTMDNLKPHNTMEQQYYLIKTMTLKHDQFNPCKVSWCFCPEHHSRTLQVKRARIKLQASMGGSVEWINVKRNAVSHHYRRNPTDGALSGCTFPELSSPSSFNIKSDFQLMNPEEHRRIMLLESSLPTPWSRPLFLLSVNSQDTYRRVFAFLCL